MARFTSSFYAFLLAIFSLNACKTVRSISISQIPSEAGRKNKIVASASNPIIFLVPFGSSFPDNARQELLDQCPGGAIEGVISKHQTTEYLSVFFMLDEVIFEGYCNKKSSKT